MFFLQGLQNQYALPSYRFFPLPQEICGSKDGVCVLSPLQKKSLTISIASLCQLCWKSLVPPHFYKMILL